MIILDKFKETINRWNMLKKGDRVIVACSGGPDSVALLFLLNLIKEKFGLKLFVAHINHKLRGKESEEDEKFVKSLAQKLNLRFYSKSFDIKKIAKKEKLSIEECAREVRYDYLNRLTGRIKATKIALGHNADDQAETVLMRLIRGAGSLGLSGIPPVSGKIIRPLLDLKREDIEKFLRENRLQFRIDSSNLRKDYLRNRIRLELLPHLKKNYNPNIVEVLNRTASILSAQVNYLSKEISKIFDQVSYEGKGKISLDLDKLFNYDISLRREMLRFAIEKIGGGGFRANFEEIERILDLARQRKSGKRVFLTENLLAEVSSKYLNLCQLEKTRRPLPVVFPGITKSNNFGITIESQLVAMENLPEKPYSKDQMMAFLDWDKLKPPSILRNPEPGDRFKPLGMKGTKSLKEFLTDLKVPRYEKEKVLVLTSSGRIFWVIGYRIGDEFKVTERTNMILKLKAKRITVEE
jgi:tRNA(Ile)-lysidine synthase